MSTKKIMFTSLAMLLLVVLVISCGGSGSGSSTTVNNITEVTLDATDSGCSPKTIDTAQGYLMKIAFNNSGTADAVFTVPDVPYTLTAPAGKTVSGNFTAPTKAGKYDFTCGPANSQTKGTLQVKDQ